MNADDAGTVAAPTHAAAPSTVPRSRRRIPGWLEFPLMIVLALAIAFVVKSLLVQAFYIPSGSMEDTLQVGDRVLVNKLVYHLRDIQRGDVVVFDGTDSFAPEVETTPASNPVTGALQELARAIGLAPPDGRDFIKRVIGVGGDRVTCCDAQGRITVNGVPLDEASYLYPGDVPSQAPFDVVVPPGSLWVMGDHRSASADSRAHLGDPGGGFVPVDRVLGRAFVVVWPFKDAQVLSIPDTFDQPALQAAPKGATAPTPASSSAAPSPAGG